MLRLLRLGGRICWSVLRFETTSCCYDGEGQRERRSCSAGEFRSVLGLGGRSVRT